MLKNVFPLSYKVKDNDLVSLLIICAIYIVASTLIGWVLGVIPFLGFIFSIISALVGLYSLLGIIVAILVYLKRV